MHTRSGGGLLRRSLSAAHLSPPRHQDPDELGSTILRNRRVRGTPPATADDDVVPVIGGLWSAHQVMVCGLRQLDGRGISMTAATPERARLHLLW